MSDSKPDRYITRMLAEWACETDVSMQPEDVLAIARHSLLDWVTMVLAGSHDPAIARLRRYLDEENGAAGPATLLAGGARVSSTHAALINGTAGHVLDFDDAHLPSRVHPSVPLWPAILAFGESNGVSGEKALAAFVVGVEVQTRLAALMGESHYKLGWHNTATLGSFGATAAVGWLRGLTPLQMRHAFGIAASQAGGLRAAFGTSCKPLHAGRAASLGLFASGLAAQSFDAEPSIFDVDGGFPDLYADQTFPDAVAQEEGHWDIRNVIFKYHASCYGTQAPIEAALQLGKPSLESVGSVRVGIENQYLSVCNIQTPETAAQARFSIRHMVALALHGADTASQQAFSHECLADQQIAAWRERITVQGDAALGRANACIEIAFTNGSTERITVDASRPESDLERQRQRLCAKSRALLQDRYAADSLDGLHGFILNLDNVADMRTWMDDFRAWERNSRLIQ
ncbi:MmgE/PrpD family protein [Advenella kashmirensis W13003]|uniref:MmgE/PrpD family protein n=1 Tax=Advenella kashmirensis W13003 TaxID=1424334 RepID=V8QSW2_9BURK|nr:MmgE/PrpD family protein [Advenella kashmirensis]ETF02732.1 MmgE/PrpD family protein [Advenella kashmirensis W13003]